MNARLRMYKYCYSNEGAIYAKGLLSAREQLRACVKWDLVVRDFFIVSNFVRQYFRFRLVNFFQIFGDN